MDHIDHAAFCRAREAVRTASESVERHAYTPAAMEQTFCNRNAQELLAGGHIHYGTPCADLCTLAQFFLIREGLRPTAVLCEIARWLQPVKFQCGLELTLDTKPYYVGFSVTTNRLAPGVFASHSRRPRIVRTTKLAPPGAPFLANFNLASPAQVSEIFPRHNLSRHLASYRPTTKQRALEVAHGRTLEKFRADTTGHLITPGLWASTQASWGPAPAIVLEPV